MVGLRLPQTSTLNVFGSNVSPLSLKGIAEIPLLGYLTGPRLGLGLTLTAHV